MTLLIYSTRVLLLLILTALYHHLLNASAHCHDVTLAFTVENYRIQT